MSSDQPAAVRPRRTIPYIAAVTVLSLIIFAQLWLIRQGFRLDGYGAIADTADTGFYYTVHILPWLLLTGLAQYLLIRRQAIAIGIPLTLAVISAGGILQSLMLANVLRLPGDWLTIAPDLAVSGSYTVITLLIWWLIRRRELR